jgi:hypothetical protein
MTFIHRRPLILGTVSAMAAVGLVGAASAQAAGATSAACVTSIPLTITPGFGPIASSGTLTSHGETGSVTCIGTIGGDRVTGPGTAGLDESYTGGSCLGHLGVGTVSVTIPTTAGSVHMAGAAISRRTGLAVTAEAAFPEGRFSGAGVALPTQGTCVLSPLRGALITLTGTLAGA